MKKSYKIFTGAIIIFLLIVIPLFLGLIFYVHSVKNLMHNNRQNLEQIVQNLEIKNEKNEKFSVVIKDEDLQKLNKITNETYNDFLVKYNQNQANWLNSWLTILTIALAFTGLIAPLCFMKLYEDKKEEMDKIIEEARTQKEKTKLNVEKMEEQLRQVNEKSNEVNKQLLEVNEKAIQMEEQLQQVRRQSKQMSEDLASVKKYVNEAQSIAKYTEGLNKKRENKIDEAEKLFLEALNFNPEKDDVLNSLALINKDKKEYDKALENLKTAIKINPISVYYNNIATIYSKKNDYTEAINYEKLAIENAPDDLNAGFYMSVMSLFYTEINDFDKAQSYIDKALEKNDTDKDIVNNISVVLITQKKYEPAIKHLSRLCNLGTFNATTLYNLTEAYILKGQITDSIKTIKKYKNYQKQNDCYGIYTDDYEKWMNSLKNTAETAEVKELIEHINSLEKRER